MRKQEILQAAAQIFRQKGYHAASMQDIADAVHLQKASLYHHVESKQEILLTLLDHALDILIADLEPIAKSEGPPSTKLRQAIHAYIGRLTGEADLAAVLLLEYRSLDPPLRARHIRRRDRFEALWRQILEDGIACGEFRRVDVPLTAFAILGVQNWTITWYRPDGRLRPAEIADGFADLFLEGLRRPEAET